MGRKKKTVRQSVPSLREMLVRFWPLIRKERKLIAFSTLALFGEVFLRLLEPWPLKVVFDQVIMPPGATRSDAVATWGGLSPVTLLALCAVAVTVFAASRAISAYYRRVGFAVAGSKVLTECRGELFTHLQRLSLSYHDRKRTGDLIIRVTGDIGRLKEAVVTAGLPLLAHVVTLIGMLVVMVWMDWRLALIAIAIVPLFALSTRRLGRRIRTVARTQRERTGEMGATATEAIGSIKTVQALSLEHIHAATFTARNRSDLKEGVKAKRLSARLMSTTDILIAVGTAGVLWFGGSMVMREELTPGDLIIFLSYLKAALRPIRNVAKYAGRLAKAAASAERIIEVLDTTPLIANRPDAVPSPESIETVAFDDITFGYRKDLVVIDGFSLTARRGEVVVLAGPSGAGKSTILNLLLRLYDPDSGRVTIDGRDAREFTIESLRQRVAVVPQENVLFAVSIRDNIAYGAPGATEEAVIEAARIAQAHDFITALPDGYDTLVGERGGTLSEGQRQRIAIARAAIRRAPILVLDEPTSSLDNENNRLVREALQSLSADRITFIIAHDLSTVARDNRVLFLDAGRVLEEGTHESLLKRGGRYAALCALQRPEDIGPEADHPHAVKG